jgi:hypothetical protein
MTTLRQAEANRGNAQRSTGPKSEAGRAASKWNALKHGLTAASVVIPGEDPAQLDTLHAELLEAWQPADAMEADLVWRMAMAQWQLRRGFVVEAQMFEMQTFCARYDQAQQDAQTAAGLSMAAETAGVLLCLAARHSMRRTRPTFATRPCKR